MQPNEHDARGLWWMPLELAGESSPKILQQRTSSDGAHTKNDTISLSPRSYRAVDCLLYHSSAIVVYTAVARVCQVAKVATTFSTLKPNCFV